MSTATLALVYGKLPMEKDPEKYTGSTRDIVYTIFDRFVWSSMVLYVVFACETVNYIFCYITNIGYFDERLTK